MSDPTLVRPATLSDADVLAEHNRRMALETESRDLPPAIIGAGVKAILEDAAKGFYLVAQSGSEVIGNLMVTYEWSDWRNGNIWWIQSVYVRPEHRGKGVFRKLFSHIHQLAKARQVRELRLYADQANVNAHRVYEQLGMRQSHYILFDMGL
jgi:GNAT superfamily N-acetyltransferase